MYNLLLTCNNYSTGTSVAVYGSLGSVDVYGIPVSSYSIDGGDTATYTAPLIQPGGFQTRVLFYQSPPLSPGTHELVITNLNGTAPNVLWLDYILYNPSQTTSDSGGASSSGGGSGATSTSVPASSPSNSQSTSSSSSASSSSNTGAIVGGVVGGLAGLAIISALLFLCYRKRKREQIDLLEPIESGTLYRTCFASQISSRFLIHYIVRIDDKDPEQASVVIPFAHPEERSRVNVLPMKNRAALPNTVVGSNSPSNSPSLSRSNSISQGFDPPETSALLDSQRPVIRHKDSGIRMAAPVDVPPEYTQD